MTMITFDKDIIPSEQKLIAEWIAENEPKTQMNLKLETGEYVLTVICDDKGGTVSYNVKKPNEINIPKY